MGRVVRRVFDGHGAGQVIGPVCRGVDIHGVHGWNSGIQNVEPDYHPLEKPEFVHDFLTFSNWNRVYRATADFFARKLGR